MGDPRDPNIAAMLDELDTGLKSLMSRVEEINDAMNEILPLVRQAAAFLPQGNSKTAALSAYFKGRKTHG